MHLNVHLCTSYFSFHTALVKKSLPWGWHGVIHIDHTSKHVTASPLPFFSRGYLIMYLRQNTSQNQLLSSQYNNIRQWWIHSSVWCFTHGRRRSEIIWTLSKVINPCICLLYLLNLGQYWNIHVYKKVILCIICLNKAKKSDQMQVGMSQIFTFTCTGIPSKQHITGLAACNLKGPLNYTASQCI